MNPLASVDWTAPWFSAVAKFGVEIASAAVLHDALNAAARRLHMCTARGMPLRFVDAAAAGAMPYESYIAATGEVPTRTNLHDAFNALAWLALPRSKAKLNALQADAIAAAGVGAQRGPLRDAATLIDENAVLLLTQRADLVDALRRHDWYGVFVARRDAWRAEARALVFGHALMEKLVAPYKAVTGHALTVALGADASLTAIDAAAADALDASLAPQRLLPLPLLGVPGWASNDDASFYSDCRVFRPRRQTADARSST